MIENSFKKNLVSVALSRIISLLSGIAVVLLLPKVLSVQDYGYLKIFTLYAVYTALLHFGFVDGILLKIAGKEYTELDHEEMRTYTHFFMTLESFVVLLMIITGVFFLSGEYLFILLMLALDMLFVNITTYYQFVSQATQRFAEYSKKSVIVSIAKFAFIGLLFIDYLISGVNISYRIYLIGIVILDFLMMLWYIWIYRDITFGTAQKIYLLKREIVNIFKIGIVLTVAYQTSHLVLALDRQFVSVLFSTEEYAIYSFAYNIVSMISTMVSSLSVVLLPMLKKAGKQYAVDHYKSSLSIVSILLGLSLLAYFPAQIFIGWFLPEYIDSMQYIAIILPSILLSSGISVVMFTIDKVMGTILAFFKNSVIVLVVGFFSNLFAYMIFETRFSISCASLFTMIVWYLIESSHLKKHTGVAVYKEFMYIMLLAIGFLSIVFLISPIWLSTVLYTAFVLVVTMIFYGKYLLNSINTKYLNS